MNGKRTVFLKSLYSKWLRQNVCMLAASLWKLNANDRTFYHLLPDKLVTGINVVNPPPADWVFCYYCDYPLIVFEQVNCFPIKPWLQEIQQCLFVNSAVFSSCATFFRLWIVLTTNCAPYHHWNYLRH